MTVVLTMKHYHKTPKEIMHDKAEKARQETSILEQLKTPVITSDNEDVLI